MPFWRRTAFEEAFWRDDSTRSVLLTIDKSFWAVYIVNLVIDGVAFPRVFNGRACVWIGAVSCLFLAMVLAVPVAIRRDQAVYYKHRGLLMFMNRAVQLVFCFMLSLGLNDHVLMKLYVTDKLAVGRDRLLVVFLILTHLNGVYLLWTFYFPLPFSQGVWIDLVQMIVRLVITTRRCVYLLAQPDLKPTVTAICTTMNNALVSMHPMALVLVRKFNLHCEDDAPLLLALFSWWYFGTFLPSFSAWYVEWVLKEKFAERRQLVEDGGPGFPVAPSGFQFLLIITLVAMLYWMSLHLLLGPQRSRDRVWRALLFICH